MSRQIIEKTFAENGTIEQLSDAQMRQGYDFLGNEPPSFGQFNHIQQQAWKGMQFLLGRSDVHAGSIAGKVNKEDGKGLSSNDFSNNDKATLDALASGAVIETKPIDSANNAILTGTYYTSGDVPTAEQYKVDVIVTDTQIIQTATNGDGAVWTRQFPVGTSSDFPQFSTKLDEKITFLPYVSSLTAGKHGQQINIGSYSAAVDFGGGMFIYDAARASENNGGTVINGWVRSNLQSITPEMFGGGLNSIISAANVAAVIRLPLVTGDKEYVIDKEMAPPAGLMWRCDKTVLRQTSVGNSSAGFAPSKDTTVTGYLIIHMENNAPAPGGSRAHVRIDSFFNLQPTVSNVHFGTVELRGGHLNANGFTVAGGGSNITVQEIIVPDNSMIGRPFMAHWGNFVDHTHDKANGAYRHAVVWRPTTHPNNIRIGKIKTGVISYTDPVGTSDPAAIFCVSAGYNISCDEIEGQWDDGSVLAKGIVLIIAGDLAMAYGTEAERARGMWGIKIGAIKGKTNAQGVHLVGTALYKSIDDLTNVSVPPTAEQYNTRINLEVDLMDIEGRYSTGANNFNYALQGANGGGSTRIKKMIARGFATDVQLGNTDTNTTIDELITTDARLNPIVINGAGTDVAQLPRNFRAIQVTANRYGITSSAEAYRSVIRNENSVNCSVGIINIMSRGQGLSAARTKNAAGYGFKVSQINQLDATYPTAYLVLNENLATDPVDVGNFTDASGKVTTACSGGVVQASKGQAREFYAVTGPTGLKLAVGDVLNIVGANPATYICTTAGLYGSTAVVRITAGAATIFGQSAATIPANSSVLLTSDRNFSYAPAGKTQLVAMHSVATAGVALQAVITADNKFSVYAQNLTSGEITLPSGQLTVRAV